MNIGYRHRGARRELLAQGELYDSLLTAPAEESQGTAKKQHREVKQSSHGARDPLRARD